MKQILKNWKIAYVPYKKGQEPELKKDTPFIYTTVPGYADDVTAFKQFEKIWGVCTNPEHKSLFDVNGEDVKEPGGYPDGSTPFLYGSFFYKTTVDIEVARTVLLKIESARMRTTVYVNNKEVGSGIHQSVPLLLDITDYINPGRENEIMIRVDNYDPQYIGTDVRGFIGFSAGITGDVYLKTTGGSYIKDGWLSYRNGNVYVGTEIALKGGCRLEYDIFKGGKLLITGKTKAAETIDAVCKDGDRLEMWSEHNPRLYKVVLRLIENGKICDSYEFKSGIRDISARGTKLFLNSTPIFLRGIADHAYFAETLTPPLATDDYKKIIEQYQKIGFNWLRCHTWLPSEKYLSAGDEMGMMFQIEAPLHLEKGVHINLKLWEQMIKKCRKHPSVVIACTGNECMLDDAFIEKMSDCAKVLKDIAPNILFNPHEAMRGVEYRLEEVAPEDLCDKPFLHNPKRLEAISGFADVYGCYNNGQASYFCNDSYWERIESDLSIYKKPCLSHEICIKASFVNLDLQHRYEKSRNTPEIYEFARRNMEREGILSRASLYYRNSCLKLAEVRKHCVENMRKCDSMTGYDYLGAIDYQWHRNGYNCGILNEFYDLKYGDTEKDIMMYNAERVLLLYHPHDVVFESGEVFDYWIAISNYGQSNLNVVKLFWSAYQNGKKIKSGEKGLGEITNGGITKLCRAEFEMPGQAGRVIIKAFLVSGETFVENEWSVFCYPNAEVPDDVVFTDDYECAKKMLKRGESVIFNSTDPFSYINTTNVTSNAGRADSYFGSVIDTTHPLIKTLPYRIFMDWQFDMMLKGGRAAVLNGYDVAFDPIIEMISSGKKVLKQALMVEFCVGNGKLLMCMLNLDESRLEARYLKKKMAEYVKSNDFNPKHKLDFDAIKGKKEILVNETDFAEDPKAKRTGDL